MRTLIKYHVITQEDINNFLADDLCLSVEDFDITKIDINSYNWNWNFHQIALVDEEEKRCYFWNDITNSNPEIFIEGFLAGQNNNVCLLEDVILDSDLKNRYVGDI